MTTRIDQKLEEHALYASTLVMTLNDTWRPVLIKVIRKLNALSTSAEVTASTTLATSDGLEVVARVRSLGGAWTVTLPAEYTEGDRFVIKDAEGNAAANNITDPSKVRAGQSLVIPGYKSTGMRGSAVTSSTPAPVPPAKSNGPVAPTPATTPPPAADPVPHFELTPPPPGQDLDAGLRGGETEVPTIKVEDPTPTTTPTN